MSVGGVHFATAEGTLRDDPRLVIRVLPLLAAQKIDVPIVLVGAQIGPFETRFGRRLSRRIVTKAAAVFPRDRRSASEFRGLDAQRRSILLPDSALALTFSTAGAGNLLDHRGLDVDAPTLALVISRPPRSWRDSHNFHHANVGRIAGSNVGAFPLMTTEMWRNGSRTERLTYRLIRHPVTILCAYLTIFFFSVTPWLPFPSCRIPT